VLEDLGIKDRPVLTLQEREAWVEKHEDLIVRSAHCPLGEPFWREASGDPMQFLAFCFAYAQWKSDPGEPIHLPVQIDGTCNGLQHIAAIMGSESLAAAVNVVGAADRPPGDIYSELAQHAQNPTQSRADADADADAGASPGIVEAEKWLASHPDRLKKLLGRNAAKSVVMTVPYGAGARTQAQQMLKVHLMDCFAHLPLTGPELDAAEKLGQWVASQPKNAGALVRTLTKGHEGTWLDRERKLALKSDTKAQQRLATTLALLTYVSLALVWRLRRALDEKYPEVGQFTQWLRGVAEGCSGIPLAWMTPLGFPVCQDAFGEERVSLNVKLGKQSLSVGPFKLTEDVDSSRQSSGLLPNLVHSLDSTHLAMAIWRVAVDPAGPKLVDFGAIHDCLLCHPNEATMFAQVLRSSFAELYAPEAAGTTAPPKAVNDWWRWMQLTGALSAAPRPDELSKLINGEAKIFPSYTQVLSDTGNETAWQAVCGEVKALEKALRKPGDQTMEQVIVGWLAAMMPKATGDDLLQVWCDGVPRRESDEPAGFKVESAELTCCAAVYGKDFKALTPADLDAAQDEISACIDKLVKEYKTHKGDDEVHSRIRGLVAFHRESKMPQEARVAAANPQADMPSTDALTPEEAGAAPASWIVACLRIETVLLRLATQVKRKHLVRLRTLRALDAAVSLLRFRYAPAPDGADALKSRVAELALDFAVRRKDLGPAAAEWRWKELQAGAFDIRHVKDSAYFFN